MPCSTVTGYDFALRAERRQRPSPEAEPLAKKAIIGNSRTLSGICGWSVGEAFHNQREPHLQHRLPGLIPDDGSNIASISVG